MTKADTAPSIDEYLRERLMPVEGAIPNIPVSKCLGTPIPAEAVGGDLDRNAVELEFRMVLRRADTHITVTLRRSIQVQRHAVIIRDPIFKFLADFPQIVVVLLHLPAFRRSSDMGSAQLRPQQ